MLSEWLAYSELFAAGGWVLLIILALSTLMWMLILERYWYLYHHRPLLVREMVERWQSELTSDSAVSMRIRFGLTNQFHGALSNWVATIHVITAILPLLGLLGTMIGMIESFKLVELYGDEGGASMLAGAISKALVTTAMGLIIAIPSLIIYHFFKARIGGLGNKLEEEIEILINAWFLKQNPDQDYGEPTNREPSSVWDKYRKG